MTSNKNGVKKKHTFNDYGTSMKEKHITINK